MYSYEKQKAAVVLYAQYHSSSAVIRELGYPSRGRLRQWFNEFTENTNYTKLKLEPQNLSDKSK